MRHPNAAPARFLYTEHRTLAQVDAGIPAPAPLFQCWGCVSATVCPFPDTCPEVHLLAAGAPHPGSTAPLQFDVLPSRIGR